MIPAEYRGRPDTIFVARGSDLYRRYLASASHLISNNTFMPYFARRPGQKYLNTWHGTPIKGLGKDIKDQFMAHGNAARNLLHATHVLSPNKHTSDVLIRRNDIAGIFSGKIAETGYPRVDQIVNASVQSKAKLRTRLGIHQEAKVILYAPTWRGTLHDVRVDLARLVEDLGAMAKDGCELLFKGHHMYEQLLQDIKLPIRVIGEDTDTCELLSIVDILVTDYSSIWVDFLPSKKPIIYYMYDLESYRNDRGLYFDVQSLPGTVCQTRDELGSALQIAAGGAAGRPEKYQQSIEAFCPYEDGKAAARAVGFFFGGDESCDVSSRYADERSSLLLYAGGFVPNGVTSSCLNLVRTLDDSKYRICIAIDILSVTKDRSRVQKFGLLPEAVQVLARSGSVTWSPEERWVEWRFRNRNAFDSDAMQEVYKAAFRSEARRMFGSARFDAVIQFDGYVNFWNSAFAFWPDESAVRAVYLHNDMKGEATTRFPSLNSAFQLYGHFNYLVSVSSSVQCANEEHLAKTASVHPEKFVHCDNCIDPLKIVADSKGPLDATLDRWLGDAVVIGTLGRLSPEKDHRKLIDSFNLLLRKTEVALKLVIGGDGILRATLQARIDELGLGDRVMLAGQLVNPYPLLRRLDLFVLSSNYEGQGIVILEALTLEKPVVSTDVVGPRTILEAGYGLLVENSAEALAEGMRAVLSGETQFKPFDPEAYLANARAQFDGVFGDLHRTATAPKAQPRQAVRRKHLDTNKVVVAARADGLGERMNAILNGMYLAKKLGFDFAYHWTASGTWEVAGADIANHAILPEDQFFSLEFISQYSLEKFESEGFREVAGTNVSAVDLLAATESGSFRGWLAPRLDLHATLNSDIAPDATLSLGNIFNAIGFHPAVAAARDAARAVELPEQCVAMHLRSGDIFYGPYRKLVHYTYKGITLPIAKAIISKLRAGNRDVLLFGQDEQTLRYLRHATGALLLRDFQPRGFDSAAAQAIFELVLMSRCDCIVAGSSGFAKQASWIGGVPVKQPKDFFDHAEQTRISVEDLALHGGEYHPLQTAFAYWYAYFYGRHSKSFEDADMLLAEASRFDPENQLYSIKRAANCFRNGRFDEGNSILARLMKAEFMNVQSAELPVFRVLAARTLGQFNLAEDLGAIDEACRKGYPYAAVCDCVIKSAAKESTARALRVLKNHRIGDAVIRVLYDRWGRQGSGEEVLARLKRIERPALPAEADKWYGVRFAALDAAIGEVTLPGDFAEFGVYRGRCAEFVISYLRDGRQLHLFDSFEGLPQDWIGQWKKGVFALPASEIPRFGRDDVHVHVGWFKDTIPRAKHALRKPLAFIHADADLYSSTLEMLDGLNDCIAPGTVILFDEYVFQSGDDFDDGEHRALLEWASKRRREFDYLWRTEHYQVAIRVTE
jgi:CDP-glycerol glycerophosphotransferase (TagB/SpsB family)/glycosyltransferase involved in cell wall biosynthesis